jgi:hypothetical protein
MGNLNFWKKKDYSERKTPELNPIPPKDWVKLMKEEQIKYNKSTVKNKIKIKKLDSNKEIIYFDVEENLPNPTPLQLKKVKYYYGGKTEDKNDFLFSIKKLSKDIQETYITRMGIKTNIYRMSMNENDEILSYDNKNFIKGYLEAYRNHCPIGFSPDVIWQIILVGFAKHVDANAEKLRYLFVDFKDKKTLYIPSFTNTLEEISLEEWQDIFSKLNKQMNNYVKGEIIDLITPNFTTTTKTSLAAAHASIMASMKNYFDFDVGCVGCGIPRVYLEGTLEDWEKLLIKVQSLEKYDLKWWTDNLQKIIKKIIETKKGNVDVIFWKYFIFSSIRQIVEYGPSGLSQYLSDQRYIGGWILYLFPYDKNGYKNYFNYFDEDKDFPIDLTDCPIVVTEVNKDKKNLTLYSGFMGLKKSENDNYYIPEIGWYLKKDDE